MILSDRELKSELASGGIAVSDWQSHRIQSASIDLTLDDTFLFAISSMNPVDPFAAGTGARADLTTRKVVLEQPGQKVLVSPNDFILASTAEEVRIGPEFVGILHGKSSLARLGLLIHVTAGYIDPGFEGRITLEMAMVAPRPIYLHPGMDICQLSVQRLSSPAEITYSGRYQGQQKTQPSLYGLGRTFPS
jgi:dCTP deaminase